MSDDAWGRIRLEVRLQALRVLDLPKEFEPEPIKKKGKSRSPAPNTSGDVAYKTENRNHALETRAWEMVPVELPATQGD